MSVSDTATCRSCGDTFTPDPKVVARFDGWVPPDCPSCYRRSRSTTNRSTSSRSTIAESDQVTEGVFTDGSASPNPGPGGWGAVRVVDDAVVDQVRGGAPDTTNNRMELRALIAGVDLVPEGETATLWSDSNLAVRTVNEWAAGWRDRGWTRKRGPVENLDLVRELFERFEARPELRLRWIKAHVGHRWNEYADRLADEGRPAG